VSNQQHQKRSEARERKRWHRQAQERRWEGLARSGRDREERQRRRAGERLAIGLLMVVLLLGLLAIAYLRARM
jgi:hypothetical protein